MKRIILTLVFGLLTAIALWYGINPNQTEQGPAADSFPALATATLLSPGHLVAPFALKDTSDHAFTQQDLLGHWTILFFGYATCPDICPRSLAIASDLWKKLPELQMNHQPRFIFVTLNPAEDKQDSLKSFLGRFHQAFIGLTGDALEVENLAKSCRVYHLEDEQASKEGRKVIDHTASFILINPKGQVHALFTPPHNSEQIAKDLAKLIAY